MIRTISARNFMSFATLDLRLADKGLVQIDGEVLDEAHANNNGVGKTAILDLILWTIFGHIRRADSVNEIVHTPAGKNCQGSVLMDTPHGALLIRRFRKDKDWGNEIHVTLGDERITATDNNALQERIEQIIGMDVKTFMRALIFDGSMSLARMNDGDAKDFLERLLGLDLSNWHSVSKEYEKTCQGARQKAEADLEQGGVQHFTISRELQHAEVQQNLWETEASQERARLMLAVNGCLQDRRPLDEAHTRLVENHLAASQEEARLRLTLGEINQSQGQITQADQMLTNAEWEVRNARAIADQALNQMETNTAAICPSCQQPLSESQQEAVRKELKLAYDERTATLTHFEAVVVQMKAARDALPTPLDTAQILHDLNIAQQRTTSFHTDLNVSNLAIQASHNTEADLRRQINGYENNPHTPAVGRLEEDLRLLDANLVTLRQQAAWYSGHVEAAQEVTKMFSREGLRSYVLDMVIPFLNTRLHKYLGRLTDGEITGDFHTTTERGKEKFHIRVNRKGGGQSYKSLSTGEKSRFDLALVLAILDHVRTKMATPVVFFDELFDGLDSSGVERVISVLREASQSSLVVIISHNPAIKMHVDNVIRIVKEDKVSRVENQ